MPPVTFKIAEARARFSELLARVKSGEEIIIAKGAQPIARLAPISASAERETAPLAHLNLPADLFDTEDVDQAAIDAGDHNDALGIWRGHPNGN